MATAKQRYIAKLNEIAHRFDSLEAKTVRDMVKLLQAFRKDVVSLLADLPNTADYADEFNRFRLSGLRDGIDEMIVQLEGQLTAVAANGIANGSELGLLSVTEPLTAAGITTFYNRPSMAQVNTLVDFSADLIRGVTSELRRKLNTEISRLALGALSPFQVQKNVTQLLGLSSRGAGKQVVRGIGYNAERIVRTEVNRAYNLSNYAQSLEVARETPGALKRWNSTGDMRTRDSHINAHGQLRPLDKPFNVKGEELQYPLDPAGSAANTINCRCRMTIIHPDIGVVGGPLDGRIAQERKRRKEQA